MAADVRTGVLAWLDERGIDPVLRQQAEALWPVDAAVAGGDDLLSRVAAVLALGDPRALQLAEWCSRPRPQVAMPDFAWLADDKTPAIERCNLQLLLGRWMAQNRMYDEALEQLQNLKPEDVVDPAGLLFYQGVVHHRLLNQEPGLDALARLLERQQEIPQRYRSIGQLMQADLVQLKDETLDHIARRMDDIERRLDLGRAGPKVRGVEDGVIASLDKLIEEIEKQQDEAAQAAAQGGAQGRGGIRSSAPARDSIPLGGKGPGNVNKKTPGKTSGWGDLPPKERQEAMQQIGKDFPAHYRDVIEQYFRKLANEDNEQK